MVGGATTRASSWRKRVKQSVLILFERGNDRCRRLV